MINYFGYGANSTPEMMEAIIGRVPKGQQAVLNEYGLFLLNWDEISEKVKKILSKNWGSDFKTYCIRPKQNSKVVGTIWEITPREREIITKWEFWYEKIIVKVKLNNRYIPAQTEMIDNDLMGKNVNGVNYNPYVVDKEEILDVARRVRKYSV